VAESPMNLIQVRCSQRPTGQEQCLEDLYDHCRVCHEYETADGLATCPCMSETCRV